VTKINFGQAINLLPITDREYYTKQVSNHITQLQRHKSNKNLKFTHNPHMEWNTMKAITAKLKKNNAIVTSANKGNTIVILPSTLYQEKTQDFVDKNNFLKLLIPTTRKLFKNKSERQSIAGPN